jgi:hypothetical protein
VITIFLRVSKNYFPSNCRYRATKIKSIHVDCILSAKG